MNIVFEGSKELLAYKVSIDTKSHFPKKSTKRLTYLYEIKKIGSGFNGNIVNFKRSRLILNNTLENKPIEEVLLKLGEVVSDLDLEITHRGEITRIKNLKKVQQNWELTKYVITKTYFGGIVDRLVESTNDNVMDKDKFIKALSRDTFFNCYLHGIYAHFQGDSYTLPNEIKGPKGYPNFQTQIKNTVKVNKNSSIEVLGESKVSAAEFALANKEEENQKKELIQNRRYVFTKKKILQSLELRQQLLIDDKLSKMLSLDIQLLKI